MLINQNETAYDIIIQAGQSNSEGCGRGQADDYVPDEKIVCLESDFSIAVANERIGPDWRDSDSNGKVNNFALSFAKEYLLSGRLAGGRKLMIIRAAVGGTGFADKRWGMTDDLYLKMMELIKYSLNLNPANELVAFLWHQGETDACYDTSRDLHYKNLKELIESVRVKFNCPFLPFIAGDFVPQWKARCAAKKESLEELFPGMPWAGNVIPVVTAIKDVCSDIGNAEFVKTDGLSSNHEVVGNGDIIHFSRDALNKLGVRYYKALGDKIWNLQKIGIK